MALQRACWQLLARADTGLLPLASSRLSGALPQQLHHPGGGSSASSSRGISTSMSPHAEPEVPAPDPFTQALQSKAQEELLALLERNRQQQPQEEEEVGEEEEEEVEVVNPETGEVYGYRGKEPTRFGDWEHKGRCTDFS